MSKVEAGSVYKNRKNGEIALVLAIANHLSHPGELIVVFSSYEGQWALQYSEFCEQFELYISRNALKEVNFDDLKWRL